MTLASTPPHVAVIGGGCSGLQYKMDLQDAPANRDFLVESYEFLRTSDVGQRHNYLALQTTPDQILLTAPNDLRRRLFCRRVVERGHSAAVELDIAAAASHGVT